MARTFSIELSEEQISQLKSEGKLEHLYAAIRNKNKIKIQDKDNSQVKEILENLSNLELREGDDNEGFLKKLSWGEIGVIAGFPVFFIIPSIISGNKYQTIIFSGVGIGLFALCKYCKASRQETNLAEVELITWHPETVELIKKNLQLDNEGEGYTYSHSSEEENQNLDDEEMNRNDGGQMHFESMNNRDLLDQNEENNQENEGLLENNSEPRPQMDYEAAYRQKEKENKDPRQQVKEKDEEIDKRNEQHKKELESRDQEMKTIVQNLNKKIDDQKIFYEEKIKKERKDAMKEALEEFMENLKAQNLIIAPNPSPAEESAP